MKVYMVERDLEGISLHDLGAAKDAATAEAQRMIEAGVRIRYLRSTFVPGDGRCMCLFEAEHEEDVRALNNSAGLPFLSVVAAYDLSPTEIRGA